MRNQSIPSVAASSVAALLCIGSALSVSGQVSRESMQKLRVEKLRFNVPTREIVVDQGQPIFLGLCQASAVPGIATSLTLPTRANMMGAGVCGMTNVTGSTTNPVGGNPPYSFTVEHNFMPFGLTLNNTTGFIAGVPTQPGSRTIRVCATDLSMNVDCKPIKITVRKKKEEKKKKDAKDAGNQKADAGEPTNVTPPPGEWSHGGGAPVGKIVGAAAASAAGIAGGLYASDYISKQVDSGGSSTPSGSSSSGGSSGSSTAGGMTYGGGASFNCTYNAGGVVNSCAGSTITVNITVPMSVGSSLKLSTNHIQSNVTTTTKTNPPGTVTFSGFSGGGWTTSCGPPVTTLTLLNLSVSSSATVASVSGLSLPVTCR
jgi:hypothetical protein